MITETIQSVKDVFGMSKSMFGNSRGQAGIGVIGAVMMGIALAIFLTVTLFNALNLNTGLYSTVINTLLPLLAFAAIASFVVKFLL